MYSSQRAISFLPELKRNRFAWDILNQSHRFSMFWKNASTTDIGWLNTTFACCFIWRSKQRAGFSSLVCSREVISDIVLEFYCVQSLTSVFVSCFLFYWSTLVRLVSSLWRNRNKHWKGFALQLSVECHQNRFSGMWPGKCKGGMLSYYVHVLET